MKHLQFASIKALALASLEPSTLASVGRASRNQRTEKTSGVNWETAAKLAVHGDVAKAKTLVPAIVQNANEVVSGSRTFDPVYRDDGGLTVDIGRYITGEPECWLDVQETAPSLKRIVRVIVNTGTPHTVSAARVDKVGAAVGGAILGLQARGYTVELYFAKKTKSQTSDFTILASAPVNPGGGRIDGATLAAIFSSWFHRRIIFSLWETQDAKTRSQIGVGHGYGISRELTSSDAAAITGGNAATVIDVNRFISCPEAARDAICNATKTN